MGVGFAAILWLCVVIAPFLLREPRVRGTFGYVFTAACWAMLALLLPRQAIFAIVASQIVSRAAMIVLAWSARPAADAPTLQARVTTSGAILALACGIASLVFAGWPVMFLQFATAFVVIRIVMAISYAQIGGINTDSLGYVRQSLEVLVLAIALLPKSSPSAAGY